MASDDWLYWLGWLAYFAINVGMIYFIWWAIFADRPRGRRRCPKCWYDMSHSPGMTCAECGFTAERESDLFRTRRRFGLACIGLLVCLVTIGGVYDRIYQEGITRLMPTKALILTIPLVDDARSDVFQEIDRRVRAQSLSDFEWSMLLRRSARGDWWARPPADDWVYKYGVFVDRWRGIFVEHVERSDGSSKRVLTDRERMLLQIPVRLEVRTREKWPTDAPASVQLNAASWWPVGTDLRLRVRPHLNDAPVTTLVRSNEAVRVGSMAIPLATLPPGRSVIRLDVDVERRVQGVDDEWQHIETRNIELHTEAAGVMHDLIEQRDAEELAMMMRRIFTGRVVAWERGQSPVRFQYAPQHSYTSRTEDMAIGVSVLLLHQGQLARHLRIWWKGGSDPPWQYGSAARDRNLGWEIVFEDEQLLQSVTPESDGLEVIVRGDPVAALRAGDVEAYWSGEFTVPARVLHAGERADDPDWWVESIEYPE